MGKRAQLRREQRDQGKVPGVPQGTDDMQFQGRKVEIKEMHAVGRRVS